MKLYTFFQSGSAYRVRIALALKGIEYEPIYIVGGRGSPDLAQPEYLALNPSGVIPTLIDGDYALTQSSAILEYLDEAYPEPALLPDDIMDRARVRAMAQTMISDTHPLSTARVIEYLDGTLKISAPQLNDWLRHWNKRGFGVIETMLEDENADDHFCHGSRPTVADLALVSQVFVAQKLGIQIAAHPNVLRVYHKCMEHPAFRDTAPDRQPDAVARA